MKKVTATVVGAFVEGRKRSVGSTATDGTILTLHGNTIAERMSDGSVVATLAGWPTVTTRERLNGLCELLGLWDHFRQKDFCQFYGSREIGSTESIVLVEPAETPVAIG